MIFNYTRASNRSQLQLSKELNNKCKRGSVGVIPPTPLWFVTYSGLVSSTRRTANIDVFVAEDVRYAVLGANDIGAVYANACQCGALNS